MAHIPRHAGAKRNKTKICTVCGKSYVLDKYLEQHFLKHHSGASGTNAQNQNTAAARRSMSTMPSDVGHCNVDSAGAHPHSQVGATKHDVMSMLPANVDQNPQTMGACQVQQPPIFNRGYFQTMINNLGNGVSDLETPRSTSFILPLVGRCASSSASAILPPIGHSSNRSSNMVQLCSTLSTGTGPQSSLTSTLSASMRTSYMDDVSSVACSNFTSLNGRALTVPVSSNAWIQRHSLDSSSMESLTGCVPEESVYPRSRAMSSTSNTETTSSFNLPVNFQPPSYTSSSASEHVSYELDLINSVIFDTEPTATSSAVASSSLLSSWRPSSGSPYTYDSLR